MTDEEIEAAISSDEDEAGTVLDWSTIMVTPPQPKVVLNMRVDYEVMEFFEARKGYQKKSMPCCVPMWSISVSLAV